MKKTATGLEAFILEKLKQQKGYISGEVLARSLHMSRQALWKHISAIIDKGYEIVAVPHLGYKLVSSPDKLYAWEVKHGLKTRRIARQFYHYETIESTQSLVWNLGLNGAAEGATVVAEMQTKGRGRLQRQWVSPAGGIYFSLLLRPLFLSVRQAPHIALLAALGCIYGIKKATNLQPQVKWPNDIYLDNKKLGGILCEINAEIDRINFVVVGAGININTRDLPSGATSLFRSTRKKFCRITITRNILEEIETCYLRAEKGEMPQLLQEWGKFCMLWGKRIQVKIFDTTIEGEAAGIDNDGFLRLRRDSGFIERIPSGDVIKVNVN